MKNKLVAVSFLVLSTLVSTEAMAGDPVVGAIIGGGVGAAVGKSMGGRDGAVVGGMLGAMTGVMIAADRDGRREPDDHVRHDDYRDRDYREPARLVYAHPEPRVIYRDAPVVVVRQPAPRVVVYPQDGHPGRGHHRGHYKRHGGNHHQHARWSDRRDGYAYQNDRSGRDDWRRYRD